MNYLPVLEAAALVVFAAGAFSAVWSVRNPLVRRFAIVVSAIVAIGAGIIFAVGYFIPSLPLQQARLLAYVGLGGWVPVDEAEAALAALLIIFGAAFFAISLAARRRLRGRALANVQVPVQGLSVKGVLKDVAVGLAYLAMSLAVIIAVAAGVPISMILLARYLYIHGYVKYAAYVITAALPTSLATDLATAAYLLRRFLREGKRK